jgi:hypothetical protein
VPIPFSKRVENEYCVCFSTPLAVESVPLPFLRSPFQTADAVRFIDFGGESGCFIGACEGSSPVFRIPFRRTRANEVLSNTRQKPRPPKSVRRGRGGRRFHHRDTARRSRNQILRPVKKRDPYFSVFWRVDKGESGDSVPSNSLGFFALGVLRQEPEEVQIQG